MSKCYYSFTHNPPFNLLQFLHGLSFKIHKQVGKLNGLNNSNSYNNEYNLSTNATSSIINTMPIKNTIKTSLIPFDSLLLSVWTDNLTCHESLSCYVSPHLGSCQLNSSKPKQPAACSSPPCSCAPRHCLHSGMEEVCWDRGWMEGKEFSKIYFCLNPIHPGQKEG